ncbi:hypothetical protein OG864_24745 [Streptomyces sp. NBC_00124]|uniref:hypothetical protein n=1 Tax=Streptomyces sp. NBC_00124 TaxID=2975662 RepID=UPI00224CA770|nr:hypothetical protein [Streptomyces sp. NBC_00124]MCX5361920.1 hypothetical protein [Streptomyces sp. NBC_00124]
MAQPNTRRLDKEIQYTERKLEAVRKQELWPLTGAEKRAVTRALIGGSYKVVRGKSTSRAERKLETLWQSVMRRLAQELSALENERQRIVNEYAAAKAAKKSSGWW